jgi:hypothetical protein
VVGWAYNFSVFYSWRNLPCYRNHMLIENENPKCGAGYRNSISRRDLVVRAGRRKDHARSCDVVLISLESSRIGCAVTSRLYPQAYRGRGAQGGLPPWLCQQRTRD